MCNNCGVSFGSEDGLRPLLSGSEHAQEAQRVASRALPLFLALLPVPLAFLGFALTRVLSCSSSADRVQSCARLPGAEPILTFLTVYCGWAMVFWVPAGLILVAINSAKGRP